MPVVISAEHLTKTYRLGAIGGGTLQSDLSRWWAGVRGRPDPTSKIGHEPTVRKVGDVFRALNDVSFTINQGDIVGIIGRNGAGKSTLLKLLSQVTAPTSGRIGIQGRVASLLEVGTGFHPELTGRENVFLNGAILGMTKAEIRSKFDEIVAFSECEAFIDTPVKRYSSGMYVRLAFAVAAHLEPEILIIDEVLAVGDAQFQKKCLGKMQEVGQHGRTVLFVSHTMSAITRLCTRGLLLGEGKVVADGGVLDVVARYLSAGRDSTARAEWADVARSPGNDVVRIRRISVLDQAGRMSATIDIRTEVSVEVEYDVLRSGAVLVPNMHVYNGEGVCVFISHDWSRDWRRKPRTTGRYRSVCRIPPNFLAEGSFVVGMAVSTYLPFTLHAWAPEAVSFEVIDSPDGDSARGDYAGPFPGVTRPILNWTTESV